MIKNTAFLAALSVLVLTGWLAGELSFLAPYKHVLFGRYGVVIAAGALLVFLNLCAVYYGLARWLFVRETGRKLAHVDQQLLASDGVHENLPARLWSARW